MADRKLNLYAADIAPNDKIEGSFLVKRKYFGIGKTGKHWLSLTLLDKSGEIDGRIWDDAETANDEIEQGDYVMLEGIGTRFMDKVQLKVTHWQQLDRRHVDPADYLPVGTADQKVVVARLDELLAEMKEPHLAMLLQDYRADPVFMEGFQAAPAAKTVHHAYIGGLLDHTVSMMEMAKVLVRHYRQVGQGPLNEDLIVAGAFLHDSGKVWELSREPGFGYTDAGQMIGHIQLGLEEMNRRIQTLGEFPEALQQHLAHLILSHHGEFAWGAPVLPKTLEALVLHAIDNLDSRVQIFNEAVATPRQKNSKVSLGATIFVPALDRHILVRSWEPEAG